ncbi:hypothetical protein [Aquamicrobium sp. LC103]|uniref:cell division protein FtsL n=1 Tax=Aquamicrobium sp. LC103 TaxID=1120658 RepID=UPI00063E9CD9|nr:hypothetical protein [Aquamicrobium sp. LC103]TKT80155.1 hypothetical protein XW59_007345 [Aquamicrobium sp. LC103]
MFRTTDIVLIAAMVAAAAFTYTTKHQAEAELSKLRKIEATIRFEEETIDVLKADWSLLTQPSRLQRLAEVYQSELQLEPVDAHQIADINELPMRALEIEDLLNQPLGGMADAGIDGTVTSGVVQ